MPKQKIKPVIKKKIEPPKEKPKIATGFDRNVDYEPMKNDLTEHFNSLVEKYNGLDINDEHYVRKKNVILSNMINTIVPMIQLRNGSRISEACEAFKLFIDSDKLDDVIVKIAKSEAIKYKKGEKIKTKARYRKLTFPTWIDISPYKAELKVKLESIKPDRVRKRVLDYMLRKFKCNTHSLRYACINYLIYTKKTELNTVAKFVGHCNMDMLTRYTQQKNVDKLLDFDM